MANLKRELLNKLAALEAVEADKKERVKDFNSDIKALRRDIKQLRGEMEAERVE